MQIAQPGISREKLLEVALTTRICAMFIGDHPYPAEHFVNAHPVLFFLQLSFRSQLHDGLPNLFVRKVEMLVVLQGEWLGRTLPLAVLQPVANLFQDMDEQVEQGDRAPMLAQIGG